MKTEEGGGDEVTQDVAPWEHSPWGAEGYNSVMELHLAESKAEELVGAIKEAFGVSGSTD
jgi:hypothetical protein